ncbi:MAG: TIM barrel protein [Cytophagales bacterium]|jgi:hydroxypyruvate isomerase|nr:TIM barrel protein [Cytophagales bacterium]MCA6387252.1 TIM barrel protein [Cytophagales bacterium]MCA6392644.1 TIM barrel protein [Cytophagales bacterium]MCA6396564.1 TIM barrel protein [Cytophagales bacterium]MCA6398744.1 TIM barrel protein [Cytophagales bacterium]
MNRNQAIKKMAVTALGVVALPQMAKSMAALPEAVKGKINHSVCQWCYSDIPLDELCAAAKKIGIKSIDLLNSTQWATAAKYGLTCAMAYANDWGLQKGFNNPAFHEQLLKDYTLNIPKAAEAGLKNVICFSGNANGLSKEEGLENCARGLEPVLKVAAQYKMTVSMELLNSKVDHKDYQCDYSSWGVQLCEKLGSPNFKLLYDIYHMQIMEGDVIATIRKNIKYISHFHTGGVPGRHEIDETQELFYPAIMKAIVETGFTGFVAQEFIPANPKKLMSLENAVKICDV